MSDFFKLNGRIDVLQGKTTLAVETDGTHFVSKGFNSIDGVSHVADFTFTCEMDIRNAKENDYDGSVSFDYYGLKSIRLVQIGKGITGSKCEIIIYASLGNDNNPVEVFRKNADLGETFDTGIISATKALEPKHYVVTAGEKVPFADQHIARFLNLAPVSNDDWAYFVSGFTSTKPPLYTPMGIRKNSVFIPLNRGGEIRIRKNGIWKTLPKQIIANSGKENLGTSRIRKNSKWVQQSVTSK